MRMIAVAVLICFAAGCGKPAPAPLSAADRKVVEDIVRDSTREQEQELRAKLAKQLASSEEDLKQIDKQIAEHKKSIETETDAGLKETWEHGLEMYERRKTTTEQSIKLTKDMLAKLDEPTDADSSPPVGTQR